MEEGLEPRLTDAIEWVRLLAVEELPPNSLKTVQVGPDAMTLVNVNGSYFGIGAVCNHQGWDLSEGSLEGTRIVCAGHGATWDLWTGKAEFDEPLDDEPLYDVRVDGGFVYARRRP